MGFKNLHEFNLALLAKQGWQIMHEINSLWARVIKARYFPDCFFLDAKNGGRSSWAWASLLTGGDILLKGLTGRLWVGKTLCFELIGDHWVSGRSYVGVWSNGGAVPSSLISR